MASDNCVGRAGCGVGYPAGGERDQGRAAPVVPQGARLWPVYCSQCHNARPGSEFAPYQWNAIMMHMRTQANLPAKDARAVLEYLKSSH